jgi:hypothetical protein
MHQHRVSPGGSGPENVGPEDDAVAHGDGDARVHPERSLRTERRRTEAGEGVDKEEDGTADHESNATRIGGKPLAPACRRLGD